MSHHIGRWGHWGHQRMHGRSKTHIILLREGLQKKSCLTPIGRKGQKPGRNTVANGVLHTHEMRLNKLKIKRGPLGPGRTIGTVTVSRGNSLEGFTCHEPRGQCGNFQQHNSRDQRRLKQFISFIYTNQLGGKTVFFLHLL
jgi:hypothetical protein